MRQAKGPAEGAESCGGVLQAQQLEELAIVEVAAAVHVIGVELLQSTVSLERH